MPVDGEYEPSTAAWVRNQVELYESSGGTQGLTLRDTGLPVVVVTNLGASSGKVRKTPVMRVEHNGRYAMVASKGGSPAHPGSGCPSAVASGRPGIRCGGRLVLTIGYAS